jgi:molecular chaperone DnaK (HSP70)
MSKFTAALKRVGTIGVGTVSFYYLAYAKHKESIQSAKAIVEEKENKLFKVQLDRLEKGLKSLTTTDQKVVQVQNLELENTPILNKSLESTGGRLSEDYNNIVTETEEAFNKTIDFFKKCLESQNSTETTIHRAKVEESLDTTHSKLEETNQILDKILDLINGKGSSTNFNWEDYTQLI